MLAAVGFILIIAMVVLILRGKIALPPILILLSLIGSLVVCFMNGMGVLEAITTTQGYLSDGLAKVLNTACLFTFAVVYFNVLSDAGMFDHIVGKCMNVLGNKVSLILLLECLIATISHLDGSGATTMLITIPTMLPLFKKMKISPLVCLLYVGLVSGVVNMLPWTSAPMRASAATGVDPYEMWRALLPAQIAGMVIMYASCFVVGPILQKKGAGMTDEEFAQLKAGMFTANEPVLKVSKKVLYFDMILTVLMVIAMLFGWMNTNLTFMVGLSIALLVNCHGAKEMTAQIKKHGANALNMVMIIFSIGMLVGVLNGTGMMEAITNTLIGWTPESFGKHLTFVIALIGVPLSMLVGSDTVYMVMTPIFANMSVAYGGTALNACCAAMLGSCLAANLSLVGPTPYLALGLAGVEMKDNLKHNFLPTWILGIVLAFFAALTGAFPF